jgi:hypothetical protein
MNVSQSDSAAADFAAALKRMGPLRAETFARLGAMQKGLAAALAVEKGRTALRYGDRSPEAQALAARIAAHVATAAAVATESRRARAAVPDASANAAIVYGFVLDASGAAAAGVTVAAVADTQATLAGTRTDVGGAFELAVPVQVADKPAPAASFKLILGGDGPIPSYRNGEIFALVARALSYREIVLPAAAK